MLLGMSPELIGKRGRMEDLLPMDCVRCQFHAAWNLTCFTDPTNHLELEESHAAQRCSAYLALPICQLGVYVVEDTCFPCLFVVVIPVFFCAGGLLKVT